MIISLILPDPKVNSQLSFPEISAAFKTIYSFLFIEQFSSLDFQETTFFCQLLSSPYPLFWPLNIVVFQSSVLGCPAMLTLFSWDFNHHPSASAQVCHWCFIFLSPNATLACPLGRLVCIINTICFNSNSWFPLPCPKQTSSLAYPF